jgi:hypothetical protein
MHRSVGCPKHIKFAFVRARREQAIATTNTVSQPRRRQINLRQMHSALILLAIMKLESRLAGCSVQIRRKHPASLPFYHKLTTRLNSITSDLLKMHTKINIAVLLAAAMTTIAENVAIETWQFEQITERGYPWAVVTSSP